MGWIIICGVLASGFAMGGAYVFALRLLELWFDLRPIVEPGGEFADFKSGFMDGFGFASMFASLSQDPLPEEDTTPVAGVAFSSSSLSEERSSFYNKNSLELSTAAFYEPASDCVEDRSFQVRVTAWLRSFRRSPTNLRQNPQVGTLGRLAKTRARKEETRHRVAK